MSVEIPRLATYVAGLDERMEGGIPQGATILLEGGPGSMKSTLAYSLLYQNAKEHGLHGMYLTLEQPRKDLEDQMAALHLDKAADKELNRRLSIVDLGELRSFLVDAGEDERASNWFKSIMNQIRTYQTEHALDIFVLDSLNGLFALSTENNPRLGLFHFIKELKTFPKMTTFLISEVPQGSTWAEGIAGFLSDGIIRLEAKRSDDLVTLQLGVVKMRKTSHDHSYFPLMVKKGGFEVVTH